MNFLDLHQKRLILLLQSALTYIKRKRVKARSTRLLLLTPTYILAKMPPLRTPLRSISRNRPSGGYLNPYIRGQVAGQAFKGAKPAEIVRDLKLDRGTVYYTL